MYGDCMPHGGSIHDTWNSTVVLAGDPGLHSHPLPTHTSPPAPPLTVPPSLSAHSLSAVGKTSLCSFVTDAILVTSSSIYCRGLGMSPLFSVLQVPFALRNVRLLLWDSHSYPYQRALSFFQQATGVVLVFDVTRRSTFDHITLYLSDALQGTAAVQAIRPVQWLLIGNKAGEDEENKRGGQRQVSKEEAQQWAQQHGMEYVETSCVTGHNVREAFYDLAARMYVHIKDDATHHWQTTNPKGRVALAAAKAAAERGEEEGRPLALYPWSIKVPRPSR